MDMIISQILDLMLKKGKYDFSGCSYSMFSRRIKMRYAATGSKDLESYYQYLLTHKEELEPLLQVVTIKVSHFFRNPLDFEIINKILGFMIIKKLEDKDPLRIWSAGCATGEEAYTLAILVADHLGKDTLDTVIFATDIDRKALSKASEGVYHKDLVQEVKYGLLQKYFTEKDDKYVIADRIREMVSFSFHDQLSENNIFPAESIYGNFDLVLCRNLMIYYNVVYQEKIEQRLYDSLNIGGYLMLGEVEQVGKQHNRGLKQVAPISKIYKKKY
ncbi:MAG: protein-glutamate O-methyltransferase CheR [Candidatus Stygibacter frigidus]|nr:protein-glutamate O-methyltransferase CheR [Candidatus Stygibacter frigidus]